MKIKRVGMFAAEISTRSSIDYKATGVYAGVRTIGTLPNTSTTTVNVRGRFTD